MLYPILFNFIPPKRKNVFRNCPHQPKTPQPPAPLLHLLPVELPPQAATTPHCSPRRKEASPRVFGIKAMQAQVGKAQAFEYDENVKELLYQIGE